MKYPPGGSEWSQVTDGSAAPSQLGSDPTQYMYSEQSSWETSNYDPDLPQGNDSMYYGRSSYSQDTIERAPSRYSSRNEARSYGYNTARVEEYPCRSCEMKFKRESDRHRHYQTVHVGNGERSFRCDVEDCAADVNTWRRPDKLKTHNKTWHSYSCHVPGCSRAYPRGFESQAALEAHQEAAHQIEYESTTRSVNQFTVPIIDNSQISSFQSDSMQSYASERMTSSSAISNNQRASVGPTSTPLGPPLVINESSPGLGDRLDHRFKTQRSSFFKPGKVFKILWTEPTNKPKDEFSDEEKARYQVAHGEWVYSTIRRFVVIRSFDRHSECLPIYTYGGQGLLKRGVCAGDHTRIYTREDRNLTDLEIRERGFLTRRPIRIKPDSHGEQLDRMSRLNYAKIYTIEHNVKVLSVGHVASKYEKILIEDFDDLHKPLSKTWPQSADLQSGPDFNDVSGSQYPETTSSANYGSGRGDPTYDSRDDIKGDVTGTPMFEECGTCSREYPGWMSNGMGDWVVCPECVPIVAEASTSSYAVDDYQQPSWGKTL